MITYLKELISIPERVHRGDFVLRLTEGVTRPEETLRDYVVTPALVRNFDAAIALIRSAVDADKSKASYLHGSFGSGKSHFMAVLYLLLRGETVARRVPELSSVLERHGDWLEERKFFMVPYHLIGAHTLEAAILGGYVKKARAVHPEAPLPAVYLSQSLLADAGNLRARMGDEKFFGELGRESGGDEGWGELAGGWDAESFERAVAAGPADPDHRRLVGDLVETYFPNRPGVASETGEGFVGLDSGLAEISRHAGELGYDGLVLFLDELILWLASHAGDIAFLNREGQKLAKLVESAEAHRPIPIVSFIARQRDLRELVGEHIPGAEKMGFGDILRWWEGRFDTITLENRNLPTIVEKRLLKPKDDEARSRLDAAFAETTQARREILDVLQGEEADRRTFRGVYPFSPALVEILVAVSSVLQRERTALKLLLQLLVDQRDELELGDLVPVGDLFDVLESDVEPFTDELRRHFDSARRLYREKLRPTLEAAHGIAGEVVPEGPEGEAFRADDRIVKTLLLAALAPEARPLAGLTPIRLAALNHGTIRTPLPGREAQTVLQKCRGWAQEVGELKIGEGTNPVITLQLTGVDVQSILDKAKGEDNQGNRLRKVRELLLDALGLSRGDELFTDYELLWRGSKRRVDVLFGNVRSRSDLPDESLQAKGDRWLLVLDFPFDREGRSPMDDIARLQEYPGPTQTVCWLPSFFSRDTMERLGRLVILDHVLTGERFQQYASHLSAPDRQSARALLENQQASIRQGIRQALEVAYGVAESPKSAIDEAYGLEDHLQSLQEGFQPRPPVGATLSAALENLAGQLLEHQFPAHPRFLLDREIKPRDLARVWEEVERAAETRDGRVRIEDRGSRDLLRAVAEPLRLGEMHEAYFLLGDYWVHHVRRELGGEPEEVSVAKVRKTIDRPDPRGLLRDLEDLVIRYYALRTGRGTLFHGRAERFSLGHELPDEVVLRKEPLPSQEAWEKATDRAARLFGIAVGSPIRTAGNVSDLAAELEGRAGELREPAHELVSALEEAVDRVGLSGSTPRVVQARGAVRVISVLDAAGEPAEMVSSLAGLEIESEPETVARSLARAREVARALRGADWQIFEAAWTLKDARRERAEANREHLREALSDGELVTPLEPKLRTLRDEAANILADVEKPLSPSPPPASVVDEGQSDALPAEEGKVLLGRIEDLLEGRRLLDIRWTVREPEDG